MALTPAPAPEPVPDRIAQVCQDRLPVTALAIMLATIAPLVYAVAVRWLPALVIAEVVTAALMAALWRASVRRLIPARRAAMALFAAWSVTAADVLLMRVLLQDRVTTSMLALLFAAFGVVQLELSWLVVAYGLGTLGWGLVSLTVDLPFDGVEVITMIAGLGLGGLMFAVSRDFVLQNEGMRALAEQRARQLADALATVERELAERKQVEAERERLRDQVLAAQKVEAIGNLAGGIAGELDSVLTEIKTLVEQASEDAPATVRDELEQILGSCQRGAALTRNLIAFGRPEPPRREPVDVAALVTGLGANLRRTLPQRIRLELAAIEAAFVVGDGGQLAQALVNLGLNALEAIPGEGSIVITAVNVELDEASGQRLRLAPGRHVAISVRDTGVGMDPATRARMFEPFFTTKQVGQGTGLGLPTVYGIVDEHHGAIEVETAPGQGTTITIYLPRLERTTRATTPTAVPIERSATPGEPAVRRATPTSVSVEALPIRILVIDDEVMVRTTLRRVLEAAGHEVVVANGGARGLDLFRREGPFGVVVLDMMMPEMTGPECFRALRGLDPDVRVVLVSGYAEPADLRGCLDAGARGFVAKPFNRAELVSTVEAAARGSRRARTNA